MISRNKQQEFALYVIYAALMYQKVDKEFDPVMAIEDTTNMEYLDNDIFLRELIIKSLVHQQEIINIINPHLTNWKFTRLNVVSQAIILLSYTHFFYISEKVEKGIVINVAVKLAKKYIPSDDYKYINAVLDRVLM